MDIKGYYRLVDIHHKDAFNHRRDELIGQVLLFYEDLGPQPQECGYWRGSADTLDGKEDFFFYAMKVEPAEGQRPLW